MKKIICFFKGHKRGKTSKISRRDKGCFFNKKIIWNIKCKRCGYIIKYESYFSRLISVEMKFGFDGE